MKVVVLAGGDSPEREVSLRSGANVAAAAQRLGHETVQLDPANDNWQVQLTPDTVVLPILHGRGGEDGSIQAELEELGAAYAGSRPAVSALCFNKPEHKQWLAVDGIQSPKGEMVDRSQFLTHELRRQPHVLKPHDGGSSLDTFICRTPDSYHDHDIFETYPVMLLEELIEGTEITVAVLDGKALPVVEIVPPVGQEFDYENKYNGATSEICPAVSISPRVQKQAQKLAERIHELCNCRHLSRTDMMVTTKGEIYVLETNTMPGLTEQSLLPLAAKTAGMSFDDVVASMIEMAQAG